MAHQPKPNSDNLSKLLDDLSKLLESLDNQEDLDNHSNLSQNLKLIPLEHSKTRSPDEMHSTHRQDIGKVS